MLLKEKLRKIKINCKYIHQLPHILCLHFQLKILEEKPPFFSLM